MILPFLTGAIIGAVIVWTCYSCCCKKQCDQECRMVRMPSLKSEPVLIDTTSAKNYFHTYLLAPVSVDKLKAFTVNLEQFYAMGQILNTDSTVHGFRIYLGADSIPSNQVMMVVGTGSPDKSATIYKTSFSGSGPCPYFCDVSSPIMH
jgi:hypothetical protein